MPKVDVYDINGKKVSDVELNENIFGIEPNENIVHGILNDNIEQLDIMAIVKNSEG